MSISLFYAPTALSSMTTFSSSLTDRQAYCVLALLLNSVSIILISSPMFYIVEHWREAWQGLTMTDQSWLQWGDGRRTGLVVRSRLVGLTDTQSHWPTEGSHWQPFGFVVLELPEWEKGALLLTELVWRVLKVLEVYRGEERTRQVQAASNKRCQVKKVKHWKKSKSRKLGTKNDLFIVQNTVIHFYNYQNLFRWFR